GGEQQPGGGQQQPGGGEQQPGAGQQQPGGGEQQPGAGQQGSDMAEPQPDQPTFSGEQIDSFVDAYLDIIEIQEEYTAEIEDSEGSDKARELQEKANDEMVAAIEDNGLSVPEYSEIANAMDQNPELRDEISAKIRERKQE
ncbi:MAG: DUF4168 domain-containing protein, partial [Halorhodospira sp.]